MITSTKIGLQMLGFNLMLDVVKEVQHFRNPSVQTLVKESNGQAVVYPMERVEVDHTLIEVNIAAIDTHATRRAIVNLDQQTMVVKFIEEIWESQSNDVHVTFTLAIYNKSFNPHEVLRLTKIDRHLVNWLEHDRLPYPSGTAYRTIIRHDGSWINTTEDYITSSHR